MMIRSAIHLLLLSTLLLAAAGCESDFSRRAGEHPSSMAVFVPQEQARQRAFSYRMQAQVLREMAQQIEIEANLSEGRIRPGIHSSDDRLVQVKGLLASAEDADELAREYQRQVPHAQLQ